MHEAGCDWLDLVAEVKSAALISRRLLRGSRHASRSGRRRSQGAAHAGSPPLGIGSLGRAARGAAGPSFGAAHHRDGRCKPCGVGPPHRTAATIALRPEASGVGPTQPADVRRTDAALRPTGPRSTSPPKALRTPTDRPRRAPRHADPAPAGWSRCLPRARTAWPPCSRTRLGSRHAACAWCAACPADGVCPPDLTLHLAPRTSHGSSRTSRPGPRLQRSETARRFSATRPPLAIRGEPCRPAAAGRAAHQPPEGGAEWSASRPRQDDPR